MLLNNLFYIKSVDRIPDAPGKFTVHLELNEKHIIFEGHFPGMPVTPGVCLMQMVKETAGVILEKKLMMTKAENIKFMAVVNPHENKLLTLDLAIRSEGPAHWICDGITYSGKTIFFKLKAHYTVAGDDVAR